MIRISFVGDLMCSKEHINSIKKADATFDTIFSFANDKLTESDFLVGNLESPVAGKDVGITDHKWSFNSPIEFVQAIKKAGFNLVSLANNHCLDRGTDGARATVQALNDIKLDNLGINLSQQSPKFKIYNIKDIKVGFLSYTYGTNYQVNQVKLNKNNKNLVNIFNHQERILKKWQIGRRLINKIQQRVFCLRAPIKMFKMLNEVKKCRRAGAQIIAMNLHVGGQYNIMPETYTKWVANKLVRAGADIVAACHEHVIHPIVTYKNNSICAMSLGNFIYHSDSESLPIKAVRNLKAEYSIMLNVDIDKINNKVKIQKVSFSIFKNHIVDGLARVIPIEEIERMKLIKSTQLQKDVNYIVKKVTGLDAEFKISKEYTIND